jgi:hypothetical protein
LRTGPRIATPIATAPDQGDARIDHPKRSPSDM